MLTSVQARTAYGSLLELPLASDAISINPLQIRNITGLGPVKANVNTTPLGLYDAETYVGSSVGKRNIVITVGLNPNWIDQSMESLRGLLYAYFMTKRQVFLRFFSTHLPTVEILGYVEGFEPNIFSKDPEIQISVICPSPDFVDIVATIVTGVVSTNLLSPTNINYIGTVPTGFVLKVEASVALPGYINSPISIVLISPEASTLAFIGTVDSITSPKYVEVSTIPGQKYIRSITVPGGVISSILSTMVNPSTWPRLQNGSNLFKVKADSAGQVWTLTYFNRFGGL